MHEKEEERATAYSLNPFRRQFIEPEIIVRLIDLQFVGLSVLIDRKSHESTRKVVRDRRSPFDLERIVVPVLEVRYEIRQIGETQHEFDVILRAVPTAAELL